MCLAIFILNEGISIPLILKQSLATSRLINETARRFTQCRPVEYDLLLYDVTSTYIVGTLKSMLKKFEPEILKVDWHSIRDGL